MHVSVSESPQPGSRHEWIDIAKGIAILLVVVCHTGEGVFKSTGAARGESWWLFYKVSYAFMVPVFFFLSGWLSARKRFEPPLRGRIVAAIGNVAYPYAVWTAIQFALSAAFAAGNAKIEWSEFPAALSFGWAQFWFLHAFFLILLLDGLLDRIGVLPSARAALGVLLVCLPYIGTPTASAASAWSNFQESYIYFAVGGLMSRRVKLSLDRTDLYLVAAVGIVLVLAFHFKGAGHGTPLRPLAAFSGIAATLAIASLVPSRSLRRSLAYFGAKSLPIYCAHVICAAAARVVLMRLGINDVGTLIVVCSVTALVVALALSWLDARQAIGAFKVRGLGSSP